MSVETFHLARSIDLFVGSTCFLYIQYVYIVHLVSSWFYFWFFIDWLDVSVAFLFRTTIISFDRLLLTLIIRFWFKEVTWSHRVLAAKSTLSRPRLMSQPLLANDISFALRLVVTVGVIIIMYERWKISPPVNNHERVTFVSSGRFIMKPRTGRHTDRQTDETKN